MYRPEIKVLDATIRDGGLMNEWQFDKQLVKGIVTGFTGRRIAHNYLPFHSVKRVTLLDRNHRHRSHGPATLNKLNARPHRGTKRWKCQTGSVLHWHSPGIMR